VRFTQRFQSAEGGFWTNLDSSGCKSSWIRRWALADTGTQPASSILSPPVETSTHRPEAWCFVPSASQLTFTLQPADSLGWRLRSLKSVF